MGLAWRPLAAEHLDPLGPLLAASPHGAPALQELREHLLAGRLAPERVGWLVAEAEGGRVAGVATTEHCLEAVLLPELSPACLLPLWSALGPELRRAQLAQAWWPTLGPALEAAWGASPVLATLRPCWAEAERLGNGPEPEGFGLAELEELPQLLAIDRAHDEALHGALEVQSEAQRAGLMRWLVAEQRVLVRRAGGQVVFQAQLTSVWAAGAEIHGFATHPGHRGQGHAQAGLAALGRLALARGWPRLTTQLPEDRPGLRALYAAAGFAFGEAPWLQALAPT